MAYFVTFINEKRAIGGQNVVLITTYQHFNDTLQ